MKKIAIIFLVFINLCLNAQENSNINYTLNGKIYYNPNLTYWKDTQYYIYEMTLNINVGLNYNKANLMNYFSSNDVLQSNLNLLSNKIDYVESAFPFFQNSLLKKAIFIFSKDSNLMTVLSQFPNIISNLNRHYRPKPNYQPNDYDIKSFYWKEDCDNTFKNNFSHLELIKAPQAWDIHKGNNKVKLGVVDAEYNPNTIELSNTIILSNATPDFHGTNVVSLINAKNDNNFGLSSIAGFNDMKVYFHDWSGDPIVKMKQMKVNYNVRAVNNSWEYGSFSSILEQQGYSELRNVDDLLVVFAAGNDNSSIYKYPPSYNDILCVSGVGHRDPIGSPLRYDKPQDKKNPSAPYKCMRMNWKDVHDFQLSPNPIDAQTHNDKVDVVAPSMYLPCIFDQNTIFRNSGTSFAAPIVTGLAGLIYSVNPCLTANQVENIIKNTTDNIYNIPLNQPYIGKLGTGRINAEKALLEAVKSDINYQQNRLIVGATKYPVGNSSIWGNTKILAGRNVTTGIQGDVIIPNGSNVKYEANYSIELSGGFEVIAGASFEAILKDSPCY